MRYMGEEWRQRKSITEHQEEKDALRKQTWLAVYGFSCTKYLAIYYLI
jgi:hypothetical protein